MSIKTINEIIVALQNLRESQSFKSDESQLEQKLDLMMHEIRDMMGTMMDEVRQIHQAIKRVSPELAIGSPAQLSTARTPLTPPVKLPPSQSPSPSLDSPLVVPTLPSNPSPPQAGFEDMRKKMLEDLHHLQQIMRGQKIQK